MRIIAGTHKRRIIKEVPHKQTRSTRDRVKENLFNMLPNQRDSRVLDAFAGSGALGFEALSRGAKSAVFIENDNVAYKVLSENTAHLGFDKAAILHKGDALKTLSRLEDSYDTLFLDPPYHSGLIDQALPIIRDRHLIDKAGIIVVLHAKEEVLVIPEAFVALKTRTYGITSLTFLKWSD